MVTKQSNIRAAGCTMLISFCFLVGCTHEVGNCLIKDSTVVSKIVKNTTTKEEVVVLIGKPESAQKRGNHEHWSYSCLEQKESAAAVLLASPSLGSSRTFFSLSIDFENGTVSDISTSTHE